ncbi:MAG: ABC transporter permease [Candidatus Acidoferrales bacterium]
MTLGEKLALRWRRDIRENVIMALGTLRTHKVRSALTMLGIFIAVVTLTSVVAILMGFDRNIQERMHSFGVNNAFFYHHNPGVRVGRRSAEERQRKPLSYENYLAVREACTACTDATLWIFRSGIERARYKNEEMLGVEFQGVPPNYFQVLGNAIVREGRVITAGENQSRVYVAVIGEDVAKGLFGREDPIGKEINVDNHNWRVIGILERPAGGDIGEDQDDRVLVPYWTFRKSYPMEERHLIIIQGQEGRLPQAIDQARMALRISRGLAYDKEDNFGYATAESIIEQFHDLVGVVALVVAVLSSVGLLVGGVGVMNIMLVSVTERTREIGVRKAIGARRRDIVWQFLSEAITLTALAGVLAVLVSYGISSLIRSTVPNLPSYIPTWTVVLGVSVAAGTGLFFGIYPAVKAARLDPVDALRYE